MEAVFLGLGKGKESNVPADLRLFNSLSTFDSNRTLSIFLRLMSKRLLSTASWDSDRLVGGMAAAIEKLVLGNSASLKYLVDWLTSPESGGMASELGVRRAVLTVLFHYKQKADIDEAVNGPDPEKTYFDLVLEKLLNLFGNSLFIQHSSILNQESECRFPCVASNNSQV